MFAAERKTVKFQIPNKIQIQNSKNQNSPNSLLIFQCHRPAFEFCISIIDVCL